MAESKTATGVGQSAVMRCAKRARNKESAGARIGLLARASLLRTETQSLNPLVKSLRRWRSPEKGDGERARHMPTRLGEWAYGALSPFYGRGLGRFLVFKRRVEAERSHARARRQRRTGLSGPARASSTSRSSSRRRRRRSVNSLSFRRSAMCSLIGACSSSVSQRLPGRRPSPPSAHCELVSASVPRSGGLPDATATTLRRP
jgi:hypothetical protein